QRTENPRVRGSIPRPATTAKNCGSRIFSGPRRKGQRAFPFQILRGAKAFRGATAQCKRRRSFVVCQSRGGHYRSLPSPTNPRREHATATYLQRHSETAA